MKVCTSDLRVKTVQKLGSFFKGALKTCWKFCNDTGQRKQRLDIFWLCSHALGLACPRGSRQQSEHTALGAPGSAFPQHPAMDGGAPVFTCTSSP